MAQDTAAPPHHATTEGVTGSQWNSVAPFSVEIRPTRTCGLGSPSRSPSELAAHADAFNNESVGIEPGAGQTILMEEKVIPGYGLDQMGLVSCSTAAMLVPLDGATSAGKNIAASLWEPQWAYLEYPIKNLQAPHGLLRPEDSERVFASAGFPEELIEL